MTQGTGGGAELALEMKGICKYFPGVKALEGVDFKLRKGEVNVLLGENGAGKSTLIKIITGAYVPDAGKMRIFGEGVAFKDPLDAQERGVSAVYQEFNLVPQLCAYENIFVAKQLVHNGPIKTLDRKAMIERSRELLHALDIDFDVTVPVRQLSVAQRQIVEICKALCFDSRIIIFDEPSAVLTENEIEVLMRIIRRLRSEGMAIVYISHRMEEVFQIGDRVTVLRDGSLVGEIDLSERAVTIDGIIAMMVGRTLDEKFPKVRCARGEEILRVEGISSRRRFRDVSFSVRKGEVLGIAGLVGAGRTEIAKSIFGEVPVDSGRIFFQGREVSIRQPRDAIGLGISLVPEDRHAEGLALDLSIDTNMMMVNQRAYARFGVFSRRLIDSINRAMAARLKLAARRLDASASTLSGGNQQKVVLAKWLIANSKLIIFDEPTRGVDVGAKVEVYNLINELVAAGVGVVMISSELPEILGMSDRIIVMAEGEKTAELERSEATQERILRYATKQEVMR